jgi:non-specific serine/threonine protein kinase
VPATLVRLLDAERDNLRAALTWLAGAGDVERYLRLATWLYPLWYTLGHVGEGRRWLEQGLARGGQVPADLRGLALGQAGTLARVQGDSARALLLLEESLALTGTVANPTRADRLDATLHLRSLGIVWEDQGRYEEAERCFAQALTDFRELGSEANVALTLYHLGVVAYGQGDLTRARARCEAAAAQVRAAGSTLFTAFVLAGLGLVAAEGGDPGGAAAAFAEAFTLAQQAKDQQGTALRLAGVAVLAVGCGSPESAARLLGAAEAQNLALGMSFPLPERTAYERAREAARVALGAERFAAAWEAGQALDAEAAVAEARAVVAAREPAPAATAPAGPAVDYGLTPREVEVLHLVAEGRSDREIAEALFIGRGTVRSHLASIYGKLGVGSRTGAVAAARRLGVL